MKHLFPGHVFCCVVVVSIGGATGCSKVAEWFGGNAQEQASAPGATPAAETPPVDPQALADQQMGQKLQGYIEACLNKYGNEVLGSRARYAEWVTDMEVGPTGHEQNVYGVSLPALPEGSDGSDCATAVQQAAALPPENATLESAAQAYAQALTTLLPVMREAHEYYQRGNYRDDAFAKGKALHPRLVQGYAAFEEAVARLGGQVETINDQLQEHRIAEARRDPARQLEAMVMSMYFKQKKLVRMSDAATIGEDLKFAGVDVAAFTELTQGLETEMDQLEAYKTGHEREWSQARVGMFLADTKHFVNEAKGMMRRLRDGTAFTEMEVRMGRISGSPEMLTERYNRVIQQLNNTRF